MKIGIKEMIDPETRDYYEAFYDILRTPDFDDKSRVLKPLHGMKTIGYSKKKICRFAVKMKTRLALIRLPTHFLSVLGIMF